MALKADFPECLEFLFSPARYKVLYGGRGGSKSWGVARALLILGAQRKLRIMCARETQKSISDSVHHLLGEQIGSLGLEKFYVVQQAQILGTNGTEIIFAGLRSNIANLKSYESVDICWVEEAQTVSKNSWDVLVPTIRKDGSEIWLTFNPDLDTDETYRRFVLSPPPGAMVKKVNWRDNPWFPDVLRSEMEHCRLVDPDSYEHIWEGMCISNIEGAIYLEELRAVDKTQRITRVPYERRVPVSTFWDIGDRWTSIWFVQTVGFEHRFIDYYEGESLSIHQYAKIIQSKPYVYESHYLPHDAKAKQLGTGRSIEEQLRSAGLRVRIVPKLSVADGISAVRMLFPSCWFDGEKCADGIQGLRHYRWAPYTQLGTGGREPLHDLASHPSDAFRYCAVGLKLPKTDYVPDKPESKVKLSAWS